MGENVTSAINARDFARLEDIIGNSVAVETIRHDVGSGNEPVRLGQVHASNQDTDYLTIITSGTPEEEIFIFLIKDKSGNWHGCVPYLLTTPLINDDIPELFLQLREYLWNDGRPSPRCAQDCKLCPPSAMTLMPEMIFTPWTLASGCAPRLVPPSQFYYHVSTAPLSLWLDTLFSEDLLMQEDTYSSWIGPTFTVWDDDGVVRFDATLLREPCATDNQVLGRYVVTTDTWRQEPTDSDLGNLTAKIVATLHEHAGDTPPPLEPGEVAVVNDHHPWPTIHTSTGNAAHEVHRS